MLRKDLLSQASRESLASTSVIRRIFLLGQRLREQNPHAEIIDLSLGNPDLEPPQAVVEALERLTRDRTPGRHRYMDNAGWEHVRSAVAKSLVAEQGVGLASSSVYMTCGAAGALHILMSALLDPGDEVLLLAPFFVEYPSYLAVHGALPVIVPMRADALPGTDAHAFVPRMADIRAALTAKTRMLMLNSPNNPSGAVYPPAFLRDLQGVLDEHEKQGNKTVHVVSDEPYAHLTFAGTVVPPVLHELKNAWLVRSHSKDLGLAGERIGFIAWPHASDDEAVLGAFRAAARAMGFVNAPALMQRLLPEVLGARVATEVYERRAEIFCTTLERGGFAVERPKGTFFCLPRVPMGFSEDAFCQAAAARGVLVVPAAAFGAPGFFRASLTQPDDAIQRAADLLVDVARQGVKAL